MISKNIVFFYPSKNIGGAQLLFLRMSTALANLGYKVYIIDYEDGYLTNNKASNVNVIFCDENKKTSLGFKCTIVLPLTFMIDVMKKKLFNDERLRLVYWCIHPDNIIGRFHGARLIRKFERKSHFVIQIVNLIKWFSVRRRLLNDKVFFMDSSCYSKNKSFFMLPNNSKEYLPVPVNIIKRTPYVSQFNDRFAWVGRLSSEKVHSLNYVLESLENIEKKCKVFIIGDGNNKKSIISKLRYVECIFLGEVPNEELYSSLSKYKVSAVFGMGTSVLEACSFFLPAFLIDPSYKKIGLDYKTRWVHEIKEYNLGDFSKSNQRHSIKNIILDLENNYDVISNLCFDYVIKNHSINSSVAVIQQKILK